jgi:hypothetical protein
VVVECGVVGVIVLSRVGCVPMVPRFLGRSHVKLGRPWLETPWCMTKRSYIEHLPDADPEHTNPIKTASRWLITIYSTGR